MSYSPEVPRNEMGLADYWTAIAIHAAKENYAQEYLDGMSKLTPVFENTFTITFEGPADILSEAPHDEDHPHPGIGWWLKHQLPIWTGKQAVFV